MLDLLQAMSSQVLESTLTPLPDTPRQLCVYVPTAVVEDTGHLASIESSRCVGTKAALEPNAVGAALPSEERGVRFGILLVGN